MRDKESILVVDDDLDFLEIIKRILQTKNYEIETASSAGEAVSRLKERFFNVAILDISLPDTTGTELLPTLLELNPDIIAIMLTGHSSIQNATPSFNRGACAYLEKPLDPNNLLPVLTRGLEKQRLVFENRELMEELEQRNRNTNILLDVSQSVSRSLDLMQIIGSALERVNKSVAIDASCVYLLENDQLVLKGNLGFSREIAEEMGKNAENGAMGRVFHQSKPVIVNNTYDCAEPGLTVLTAGGYHSFAAIPLTILGESIGVMGVATIAEHSYSSMEIILLTAIGREISIAVRNAQLYEEASSAKALRELETLRSEFLANVSHELRTPITVIKGSASSLLQPDVKFDEESWREFLHSIDKDADRLAHQVEDLLVMSRLEAGALEVKREARLLVHLVDSIKDRLHALSPKHVLKINIPHDLPPVVIDEARITEVFTNLVENAVKYSEEDSVITVDARPNGQEVIVSVTDEGNGIPPELHEKVFDRFYQITNPETGKRKGTGLGLAICRGIIEAHGGSIWVDSEPGKGARFSFSIPVH